MSPGHHLDALYSLESVVESEKEYIFKAYFLQSPGVTGIDNRAKLTYDSTWWTRWMDLFVYVMGVSTACHKSKQALVDSN